MTLFQLATLPKVIQVITRILPLDQIGIIIQVGPSLDILSRSYSYLFLELHHTILKASKIRVGTKETLPSLSTLRDILVLQFFKTQSK